MKGYMAILAALAFTFPAAAKVKTEVVEYKQGDVVLQGYLCYDESITESDLASLSYTTGWGFQTTQR